MIDWSKYGIKDSQDSSSSRGKTGIDWNKYHSLSPEKQSILEQEQSDMAQMYDATQAAALPEISSTAPAPKSNPLPGRDIPVVGHFLQGLDWVASNPVSEAVAEYAVPDSPYVNETPSLSQLITGKIPTAREEFLKRSGQQPATGVPKFIGQAAAPFFVPGAQLGTGTALSEAAQGVLTKAAPKLQGISQAAAREGLAGAAIGGASEYAQGQNDFGNALENAAIGGALGVAGGAAVSGALKGLGKLKAGNALESPQLPPEPSYEGINLFSKADQTLPTPEPVSAETMKGNWFTNLFGDQGVGISPFGSKRKISEGPLTTEGQIVKSGLKNDAQGIKDEIAARSREAYQNFVDKLSPLKKISESTYETAMDANRANNLANTIVQDKFVTPEGNVVGEGLEGIFKKVARGQDKQFVDYLTLRHAKTRMERGERVYAENLGMTPEKVQHRIEMHEKRHPGFTEIAKEWDQFNDNMLRTYGVNEGLISQEAYQSMRDKNPFYSPMRRQFSRSEKPGRNFLAKTTGSSFSGQKAPLKEVSPTGSVRNIVDPRRTTVEAAGAWVNAAMRNRVMQSMVDQISRNPDAFKGIAEIVQKPKSKLVLNELLAKGGPDDFVESLNDDFKNLFKTTNVDQDNIVRAMVGGQPVYLQVHDPEIVKTLIGMGPQASNILLDTMSAFSNATKRGATGALAPLFAVKGATMDLAQAAIQSNTPVKQAVNTIYAIFSGIGDRLNIPVLKNAAEEYRRAGGEFSAALKGDRALNKSVGSMTREPLLSPKGIAKGAGRLISTPFKALEAIGDIAENAPRIAAFRNELERLGGERTPENVRQAMSSAREITTNFSRKGALSREFESLVPYQNAAVQGLYRFGKAFKDNPIRTSAAVGSLVVLPKMYEYLQFSNDPDYQKIPARERYRNLIVHKNEDGTFTKIPMEPAYNAIGALTADILRSTLNNDPQAMKGVADALANAYLPPIVTGALQGVTQEGGLDKSIAGALNSTIAAPFVATTANQSFTGAPIEPKSIQDRSPEQRYDERTSSIAKTVGPLIGLSPMKTDYLIRAYGGDPARLLLPLTSDVGAGNTRNTLLKNFIVDPAFTNTLTNDYFNMKEKLTQANADNKDTGKPLPSWYDDDLRKELASTGKNSISAKLKSFNEEKKKIQSNGLLTADQKADRLRDIQQQINQVYVDINSRLEKAGVPRE